MALRPTLPDGSGRAWLAREVHFLGEFRLHESAGFSTNTLALAAHVLSHGVVYSRLAYKGDSCVREARPIQRSYEFNFSGLS